MNGGKWEGAAPINTTAQNTYIRDRHSCCAFRHRKSNKGRRCLHTPDCSAIDFSATCTLPMRAPPYKWSLQACSFPCPRNGKHTLPTATLNAPSKLAVGPSSGWARWLPTARLDEHRLCKNRIGLACALGEQRKLPSLPIHHLRSQAAAEPSAGDLAGARERMRVVPSRF